MTAEQLNALAGFHSSPRERRAQAPQLSPRPGEHAHGGVWGGMVVGMGDSARLSGTGWEERQLLEVQTHCDLPLGCHKTYILIFVLHPLGHVTRPFRQDPSISFLGVFLFQKWVGTPLLEPGQMTVIKRKVNALRFAATCRVLSRGCRCPNEAVFHRQSLWLRGRVHRQHERADRHRAVLRGWLHLHHLAAAHAAGGGPGVRARAEERRGPGTAPPAPA